MKEPKKVVVDTEWGKIRRRTVLELGAEYLVEPLNVLAKKNRGRRGTLVGFTPARDGRVKLRFSDTGRVGKVEASDLVRLN